MRYLERLVTLPHPALLRRSDRPEQPALGAGEPATIVVAPAVANAVFAAIGVRLREVPFSAERYLAAAEGPAPFNARAP